MMTTGCTVGKKIGTGFMIMLAMTVFVGIGGYLAMHHMMKAVDFNKELSVIQQNFSDATAHVSLYLLNNYETVRRIQESERKFAIESLTKSLNSMQRMNSEFSVSVRDILKKIQSELTEYRMHFETHTALESHKIQIEHQIRSIYASIAGDISEAGFLTEDMKTHNELLFASAVSYILRNDGAYWTTIEESLILPDFVDPVSDYFRQPLIEEETRRFSSQLSR
jgi:hypothetical protein